jgi:hypothetical protein
MTQRFDDMAASRPKPTFPDDAPWGPMRGAFFRISSYDDKAAAALRSRKAYQEQALRMLKRRDRR